MLKASKALITSKLYINLTNEGMNVDSNITVDAKEDRTLNSRGRPIVLLERFKK